MNLHLESTPRVSPARLRLASECEEQQLLVRLRSVRRHRQPLQLL